MTNFPNPSNMTFNRWVNEARKQDGTLPQPDSDWKSWFHSIYRTSKYKFINVNSFSNWQDAANAFRLINQGV